jgi:hypothetical protein
MVTSLTDSPGAGTLISKAIDRAKLRIFCCGVNKEWRVRESVQKTGRVTFGDCGGNYVDNLLGLFLSITKGCLNLDII